MVATVSPSGPRSHPLAGNVPEYRRDPLAALTRWSREYGDLVPIRFGPRAAVLLNHPSHVEQMLVGENRKFRKAPAIRRLSSIVGNGLVTTDGELWRRQRRLAQPAFHRKRVASYGEVMVRYADDAVAAWSDGQVLDIEQEMRTLTLRIVARTLFDSDVAGDVATVSDSLEAASAHLQTRLESLLFFLPDWVPTPGNLRMRRAVARVDRVVYRIIRERRGDASDRGDLLSELLAARDEHGGRLSDRELRDEVLTLMVAGHATTSLTLGWAFHLLGRHPDADAALRAELRSVLNGRPPTVDDLPSLRFAEHVIYETLRLYPPAFATGREAIDDVEIGGQRLRRGTIALACQWALQRDPRWFEAPDEFRPQRWADGLAQRLPRGVYFPFGAGPRQCIGAAFAMQEAVLLLAAIARGTEMRPAPGAEEVVPMAQVTLQPSRPLRMTVTRIA